MRDVDRQEAAMLELKDRKVGLNSLAFSPDGTKLAASGYRGVIQLWDLASAKLERTMSTGTVNNDTVFFLGEERLAVLNEGAIKTFDCRSGKQGRDLPPRIRTYAHRAARSL